MKYWNDIDGTIFFNQLFSKPIEIGSAYIHSLRIKNDQNDFGIGFDIPEFPDHLPEKWRDKGYNTCRVGLTCSDITGLKIINLPQKEIFILEIKQEADHFSFTAQSKNATIELKARWLSLSGPSVYMSCPVAEEHNGPNDVL